LDFRVLWCSWAFHCGFVTVFNLFLIELGIKAY